MSKPILLLVVVVALLLVTLAAPRDVAAMGASAGMGGGSGVYSGGLDGMNMNGVPGDSGPRTDAVNGMGRHMDMGSHMKMTEMRSATTADLARAQVILQTMRAALDKFQDYRLAEADGYFPYLESVPQEIYHFTDPRQTRAEYLGDIDLKHPGSLLYEQKAFGGYRLVGAMYSAPANYTASQLDRIVPLGVVRWHAHTNICLPAGISELDVMSGRLMPHLTAASIGEGRHPDPRYGYFGDPRFGFIGSVATQADCEAAGGTFHPQIFGWMVHVYPFAGTDDVKVAFGMDAP